MNQDLQVDNLTVTNSTTLNGETFVKDRFAVDTFAVRFGEFEDFAVAQFNADNADNQSNHKNRNQIENIDWDIKENNKKSYNKTSNTNTVFLNFSSDSFTKNASTKQYISIDDTMAAKFKFKGNTRTAVYKTNNNVQKFNINNSRMIRQNFGVNSSVEKVIYKDAKQVSAIMVESNVEQYFVKDECVFERKIVENELKWIMVDDLFRAELIKASLADKRKQTKF